MVDPWIYTEARADSLYGGPDMTQELMDQRYEEVLARLAQPIKNGRVEVLRTTSTEALRQFEAESLDFIYIDGDHSYEAVRRDLQDSLPKVKKGGLILADDYRDASWWKDGVIRACHEFLAEFPVIIDTKLGSQIAFRKL